MNNKNTKLILVGVGLAVLIAVLFLIPKTSLAVKVADSSTGEPIQNADITVQYDCKDRLGAATLCTLAAVKSDSQGMGNING